MPESLRSWPWKQIKLVTYSAPRVGDRRWARTLTTAHLKSEFFSSLLNPFDSDALDVTDPSILPRLLDPKGPAGYRVLIPTDPITTEKVASGKHVGKTIYVEKPSAWDAASPPDFEAHEPWKLRKFMVDSLRDPRVPSTAWRNRKMKDLNPGRDEDERGSVSEFENLGDAIRNYNKRDSIWFDQEAFDRNFELFLAILRKQ